MKHNALAIALVTAATTLPATSHAAEDVCSRLFIYAVNQLCQLLPNGQNLCQPVGLAGPSPSCESPSTAAMVQIPLGPPVIQMPQLPSFAAGSNPFVPPAFPPTFPANPYGGAPYSGAPYGNNPFGNNPFAPNPYAPAAAFFPNNMRPTLPFQPAMPSNTLVQKATVAANQASPQPALEQLTKLIPETIAKPEVVAPAAVTSPETPSEIISAPIAAQPQTESPAPVAAPIETATIVPAPEPAQSTPDSAVVPLPEALPPPPAPTAVAATHAVAPTSAEAAAGKPATQATQPAATALVNPEPTQAAAVPTEVAHAEPASAPALPVTVPTVTASQPSETSLANNVTPKIEDALAHFDFDSAELTAAGRTMLDAWIKQAAGDAPILVTGHTDRLGPEPYNEKLSLLRAEAVKKYLAEKGKTAKRIVILGKGEKVPLINCAGDATPETKSCLAPNRRAEISLKPVVKRAAKVASKPAKTHAGR